MLFRKLFFLCATVTAALFLVACGGGGSSGATSTTTTTTTNSSSTTCGGTTINNTLSYATTTTVIGNTTSLSPTNSNMPSACASALTYSASNLPSGLSINSSTGVISGTATATTIKFPTVTLAISGYTGIITAVTFAITINPTPISWATKTNDHGLGLLAANRIVTVGSNLYLVGAQLVGNNYQPMLYKSTNNGVSWVNTSAIFPMTSLLNFAVASDGNFIYLTGGRTSDSSVTTASSFTYNNDVYKYNPGTNAWSVISSNPFTTFAGKEGHAMAYDSVSGKLFVFGGGAQSTYTYRAFVSSDLGLTWTETTALSSALNYTYRSNHCMLAYNNSLYLIGGYGTTILTSGSGVSADQPSVLKSTDNGANWTQVNSGVPTYPNKVGCTNIGSTLYYTGGTDANNTLASGGVRRSTDGGATWFVDAASTTFAYRYRHGMTTLAGKLIVFGGIVTTDNGATYSQYVSVIEGTP